VARWFGRALIWAGVVIWRGLRSIIAVYTALISVALATLWVLWIVIVWIQGVIYKIVIIVVRWIDVLGGWIWRGARRMGRWVLWEFSEPAACLTCVTLGVISANALPTLVLLEISPLSWVNMTFPPLAIAAIAARVFDVRAYRRWCGSTKSRLGSRMLRAYSDGAMWPLLLRREG
jgi:hypothetical protein